MSFEIKEITPTEIEISISGIIDEMTEMPNHIDFSQLTKLHINFENITYLNSGGIKIWVNFSDRLKQHDNLQVILHNCNRMVVDQINKTLGFITDQMQVESFYLPVFCNTCENSFDVHHQVAEGVPTKEEVFKRVEQTTCSKFPGCKKNWELDYIAEEYFQFTNRD